MYLNNRNGFLRKTNSINIILQETKYEDPRDIEMSVAHINY